MTSFWTQPGSLDVYIYFGVIVLMLIIYTAYLLILFGKACASSGDILNKVLCKLPVFGDFGGWSLTHVICYYIAGFLFPEQWVLIFIIGVAWEFFEVILGDIITYFMGAPGKEYGLYGDKWMDGRLSDIWYNTIGLALGYLTIMTIRTHI